MIRQDDPAGSIRMQADQVGVVVGRTPLGDPSLLALLAKSKSKELHSSEQLLLKRPAKSSTGVLVFMHLHLFLLLLLDIALALALLCIVYDVGCI